MKRLWLLLCALFLCAGCESTKEKWDAALRDLYGDNMKMRSDSTLPPK
jgi:hypothetical protein